jgi:hypothetical protein
MCLTRGHQDFCCHHRRETGQLSLGAGFAEKPSVQKSKF